MNQEELYREADLTPETLSALLHKSTLTQREREQATRFLKEIAARLRERLKTVKPEFGPEKPSPYVIAYLRMRLVPKLIPQRRNPSGRHHLNLEVRLQSGRIWWGVHAWGERKQIRRLAEAIRTLELLKNDEEPEVNRGSFGYPFEKWAGGAYLVLGHASTAEEVAQLPDLRELIERIAKDLADYSERFASAESALRRAMDIDAPAAGEPQPPSPPSSAKARRPRQHPLQGSSLADLLQRAFQARGLHFTPEQIATFYTALQTKGFVILSGISGTGKTKLAQHFAALLPQPRIPADEDAGDRLAITVQPYMLKYHRLIVPKRATQFFTPPAPGESVEVEVTFGMMRETCRFTHAAYGDSDYLSLLLRGQARRWFAEHFREGDLLYLEPQTDEDGALRGFRFLTAGEAAATQTGKTGRNWLFLSVRPDWRDSKPLLGYYNPLTSTYHWTPFLRFVLQAARSYRAGDGLAWFVILDEMNLARVEYYFGDLLSVLESGRDEEGWTREPLRCEYPEDAEGDLPPREIFLPPNLYMMGTVNVDETTHALSPKVLDRVFTLELTEADFEAYLSAESNGSADLPEETRRALLAGFTRQGRFVRQDKAALRDFLAQYPWLSRWLTTLNQALRPYELHFGYRVFDEIVAFLQAAEENGLFDPLGGLERAFDLAVRMKVLPKFHGSRGRLEAPLKQVLAWCVNPEEPAVDQVEEVLQESLSQHDDPRRALDAAEERLAPRLGRTADKVLRLLWHLYTTGFAAF